MSDIAKKMTGMFIPDEKTPKPPTAAWVQEELRYGKLHPAVRRFAEAQAEPLDPLLVQVDAVTETAIRCRIPYSACDRESKSPFHYAVEFDLNALTGEALRRA